MGAEIADGVGRRLALVAAEIFEDDDIAGIKGLLVPTHQLRFSSGAQISSFTPCK